MAKQRRTAVRSSYLPLALMALTALGMLGVSGVLVAWAFGAFESDAARQEADRTGQLAFPAIVRPMGAYEQITKDDFINPRTGQLNVVWLPEATAQVASRNMSELIGRVLKRDKQAGMVLTEADFMERGTRPGLVAGIPTGKFAMSIPVTGVAGLEQLRGGDRFDLLVSLPMRDGEDQLSNSEPAALFGGIKPTSMRIGQLSRRHGVKHLVTDGMLIALFRGEKRSTNGPVGLTTTPAKSSSRNAPAPETLYAELAVDPEEIGPLTEAISLATSMTCVLRSGLPGSRSDDALSTEGMVPVITTATPIQAFSALTDENLMDESTGRLHYYYFPPDKVSPEWLTDPAQLYGRVVARPLRRGSLITESDLLPPGTRPGISAGLPAGMAGMTLSKANVQGFENLAVGDTFSILTRVPGDVAAPAPNTTWATLQGGQLPEDDARIAEMLRTGIREVVRDAIFLSESAGDNVIIGIPELDVAKLAQLIRDNVEVFAVARSTQNQSINPISRPTPSPPTPLPEAGRGEPDLVFSNRIAAPKTVLPASQSAFGGEAPKTLLPPSPLAFGGEAPKTLLPPSPLAFSGEAPKTLLPPSPPALRGRRAGDEGAASRSTQTQAQTLITQNQPENLFEQASPPGNKISVPIVARDVPAYQAISIDDLIDPSTGRVKVLLFDPANIREGWELDARNLIDRVTLRPLQAGRPVRTTDLAPEGALPGPAIGLEPGMRGVTVNADQIIGLDSLSVGTVFDLVSARGVEVSDLADKVRPSLASSDAVKEASKQPGGRVAASRTIATGVKLLTNLGVIQVLVQKAGGVTETATETKVLGDGTVVTETAKYNPATYEERSVSQFVLAVPDKDVGSVLGLLDSRYPLQISLRPADENDLRSDVPRRPIRQDAPVRAVIQEHVRGMDIESEVFLTDRVDPSNIVASGASEAR